MVGIIVIGVIGLIIDTTIKQVETRLVQWQTVK